MLLEFKNIVAAYGSITALKNVTFSVEEGQVVSLIGANGAGKTSTMRTITGLLKPVEGQVLFNGEDVTGLSTHQLVTKGISLVPEGRQIIEGLTVYENLEMGAYQRKDKDGIREDIDRIYSIFPILKDRKDQLGGQLSGGQQQMLAIGRALMSKPKLLLLDEPSMGLAPLIVKEIFDIVRRINEQGTTVLLVEQNAKKALEVAHYGYVLETGSMVLEGPADEVMNNPRVKEAYLGGQ